MSQRLAEVEGEIHALTSQRDAALAAAEASEAQVLALDLRVAEIDEEVRRGEGQIAANRERIAAQESSIEHERERGKDLDEEIERHRRQVVSLSARADDLQQQWRETAEAVETAEELHRKIAQRLVEGERALTELMSRLDQVRGEHEQHRAAQLEQMRAVGVLGNEISGLENQVASTSAARDRSRSRMADLDRQIAAVAVELDGFRRQRDELAQMSNRTTNFARRRSGSLPWSSASWPSATMNWRPCGSGGAAWRSARPCWKSCIAGRKG